MNKNRLRGKIVTLINFQQKFMDGDLNAGDSMKKLGNELIDLIEDDSSSIFDELELETSLIKMRTESVENCLDRLSQMDLNEMTNIMINFDTSLTVPYYDVFINGLLKYQNGVDQDQVIFPSNIILLEDISYRSHITLFTRRDIDFVKNSLASVGLTDRYIIVKIGPEESNLDSKIRLINRIINAEKYLDKMIFVDSNGQNLNNLYNEYKDSLGGEFIRCNLVDDMMENIITKLGVDEGHKLIQSRQQEYISQIV